MGLNSMSPGSGPQPKPSQPLSQHPVTVEVVNFLRPGPGNGMVLPPHSISQAITSPAYVIREGNNKEYVAWSSLTHRGFFTKGL